MVIQGHANFSSCRKYRYDLSRIWSNEKALLLFIGLNPSTATAVKDDRTIKKMIHYAQSWGYGGFLVGNLFAFCSPYPAKMFSAPAPVGPNNDATLLRLARRSKLIVVAWGNHGTHLGRSHAVQILLKDFDLHCLKKNHPSGEPAHPLYLEKTLKPIPYP